MDFAGCWLYLDETPCIHVADWASYEAYGREANMPVSGRAAGTGPVDHIAFSATDYHDMTTRLNARGVDYDENFVADIDLRQLFLRDPSGVKVELNFMPEKPR
jgi:extradiol dioxygenase family protein